MRAGRAYAGYISSGDLQGLIDYSQNREHPPLVKLMYSLPYLLGIDSPDGQAAFYFNRSISALFGVLQILLLALVDPLAAFFLSLHSYTIKYTSQVYLEALPLFTSLIAVFAFRRALEQESDPKPDRRFPWLWLSAAGLGLTAASKYTYLMILFPLAFLALYRRKLSWHRLILYSLAAVGVFWLFNPYLWNDPFSRLVDSLLFHSRYTQGLDVRLANYPWYQPLIWIATSVPWHPQVFFFFTLDEFIFWLGMIGVVTYGRKQPWLLVWFFSNMAVLLAWTTKWPQYSLIIAPALCMLASGFLRWAIGWLKVKDDYWDYLEEMLPKPPRIFWWLVIGISVAITAGKVGYEYERALNRRGWTQIVADISPLPSNTVNDLLQLASGEVILATDNGVAIWNSDGSTPWGSSPRTLKMDDYPLPANRVTTAYQDQLGRTWYGTDSGISMVDDDHWFTFRAAEMDLPGARVRAIAEDSSGNIWVGTIDGLARWDGQRWETYTPENSALLDSSVFTIAVQKSSDQETLWFGTRLGVASFDRLTEEWQNTDLSTRDLGWGGVSGLLVDRQNRVWIATMGGGLSLWQDGEMTTYRASNSGLPTNNVSAVAEGADGGLWIGLGFSTEPGGLVVQLDADNNWRRFTSSNSGYNGGEPKALMVDNTGRLWIGTAINGLQIFDVSQSRK